MPHLLYTANDFPVSLGHRLHGTHQLSVSWPEFVWAAITVGKSEAAHINRFGAFSAFEMLYRTAILYANLCEATTGRLCRSDAYAALDPSEKGAVSYFLGLTTAKLLAQRLLGVPWLMHLDVYRDHLVPVLQTKGKAKPDLIGLSQQREWVVLEAKGRSGARDEAALLRAKDQTQTLRSVRGDTPVLRIAHQSFFQADELCVEWRDPYEHDDDASELNISADEYLSGYYAPIDALLASRPARVVASSTELGEFRVYTARFDELDIAIGRIDTRQQGLTPVIEPALEPRRYAGPDGVWVELGPTWSEDQMRRPPRYRVASSGDLNG